MATHLASSHSFLPSHQLFFTVAPKPHHHRFHILNRCRLLAAIRASSLDKTRITSRKKARSSADLCNDLREFMSEIGFPEGHVPSLKELSEHGRQDLANIVRRRGYKIIRELLAASCGTEVTDPEVEGSLMGKQDMASRKEDKSTGQNENVKELAEDVFLSSGDPIVIDKSNKGSSFVIDGSIRQSLQEKVVTFLQSGELEAIEDNCLDVTHENVVDNEKNSETQNFTELELSSECEEQTGQMVCVTDTSNVVNGNISSSQLVRSMTKKDTLREISSNDQLASAESADGDKDVDAEVVI